jgi:tRNA U34 5-carboxymethylaminomethyl modifying GTPase MnmE/TrmE
MTHANIIQLAKQGDLNAIAQFLTESLNLPDIIAKVAIKHDCLKVVLESATVPPQAEVLPIIITEINFLKLTAIKTVKISGKQTKAFEADWYYQSYFHVEDTPDLIKIPKSENKPNPYIYKIDIPQKQVSQKEFENALEKCSQIANSAYDLSKFYANKTEGVVKNLNYDLRQTTRELLSKKGADKFDFPQVLNQINSNIKVLYEDTFDELLHSLDQKRKHLKNFTVTLFGRTKAGKSTLRETLTRGNGSTIGKGSQRTTRDVKEYYWQGLRLLDTPGIEAYKGDDDTKQANYVIDQSDIVLFLTSDDSVQPGEFAAMAQLQEINKYFAVILNVKHDISDNLEDLEMLLDIPEMVFDEERLSQHQQHIQKHVKDYFNLDYVDITCIHAQAGFLSTKPEYQEYSSQLWDLSKIEELYSLITSQISANGQNLRLSTFSDSLINFITEIHQKLYHGNQEIENQMKLLTENKQKIKKIFDEVKKEGNLKIQSHCESLYNQIEKSIGGFVDQYAQNDIANRKQEWERIVNQQYIPSKMKNVIDEIFLDLKEKLHEFEQEYEYDMNNINIDLKNVNFRDIRKDETGKLIKRAVAVAGVFLIPILFNPIGFAAGLVGGVAYIAGNWKSKQDEKNHNNNKKDEKESLIKQVRQNKQATIKSYQQWLDKAINQYESETLAQLDLYINGLYKIMRDLDEAIAEIRKISQAIETDFSQSN